MSNLNRNEEVWIRAYTAALSQNFSVEDCRSMANKALEEFLDKFGVDKGWQGGPR